MVVTIYGASDDLVEIEGDIEDEIDALGRSPKLYIYCNDKLQFTVITSFKHGFWEIIPSLDYKTFNDVEEYKSSNWDIKTQIKGTNKVNRNSMVLTINSFDDKFIIKKKRI